MPLRGLVFLALWNDFAPARDAEYEVWHGFEHVPERVGVPGILRGRRYRVQERWDDRYFTLYEVADAAVLTSAPYLDLVQNPTAWSAEMRPDFRNVARVPCRIVASVGVGMAGHVATLRLHLTRAPTEAEVEEVARQARAVVGRAGASAIHVGLEVESLSDYPVFADTRGREADRAAALVVLVEAVARRSAHETARDFGEIVAPGLGIAERIAPSSYDLASAVDHDEVRTGLDGRVAPRPDLRDRFASTGPAR